MVVVLILLYVMNMVFDTAEGSREALFFHFGGLNLPKEKNKILHHLFLIVRGIFDLVVLFSLLIPMKDNLLSLLLFMGSISLAFPFIHDGVYYMSVDELQPGVYPKGFMDMTKTPVAWTDKFLYPKIRLALFIASILMLILSIILIAK